MDEIKGNTYTIFRNGIKKDIYKINLQTGTVEYVFTLPILFPRKLMINNGYVFALHKDYAREFDWKGIYFYKIVD